MKIEVKHIEDMQIGIFKRSGRAVRLRALQSKSLIEDLRTLWKPQK